MAVTVRADAFNRKSVKYQSCLRCRNYILYKEPTAVTTDLGHPY